MRGSHFQWHIVVLILVICVVREGYGQYSYAALERMGLQRTWSTTVDANPTVSGIAGIAISVNYDEDQAVTIHEIEYQGGLKQISPFDLGPGGQPIGVQEAERIADVEKIRLEARNLKPVVTLKQRKPVDLFVSTNTGVLQSINAETGRTNWSISVGSPRRPTSSPAANDWYVAVINGSQLYVVDRATGDPVFDRSLVTNPMVGSSRDDVGPTITNFGFDTVDDESVSKDWVYVPCMQGRVEAYSIGDPSSSPWFTITRGDVVGRPITGGGFVAWASTGGYIQFTDADSREMRFRLQSGDRIDGGATYTSPGRYYAGARNGYLYAIDSKSENIVWEFSTGQPILDRPVALGEDVLVTTLDRNLFCVNTDGTENWMVSGIDSIVSVSENRVYALDDRGQLTALSRKTGRRIGPSLRIKSKPIANSETDRIYAISELGHLYCFSELGAEYPVIHRTKEVLEENRPFARRKRDAAQDGTADPAVDSPSDVEPEDEGFNDGFDDEPAGDGIFNADEGDGDVDASSDESVDDMEDDMDFGDDDDNPFDFDDP